MNKDDLSGAIWRKSSRSNGQNNCVEVAALSNRTAVRDSKSPDSPALIFSTDQWKAFIGGVKSGEFDGLI